MPHVFRRGKRGGPRNPPGWALFDNPLPYVYLVLQNQELPICFGRGGEKQEGVILANIRTVTLALFTVIWLFLACIEDTFDPSEPFATSEIPGRYVANFGPGSEWYELRADTVYLHLYEPNPGERYLDSGLWEIRERSGSPGYFHVFFKSSTMPKVRTFTYRKMLGEMRIVQRPYYNEYFIKERPANP